MAEKHPLEALILAGGLGTRLRPVVSDRPKPVAEVAGRPFVERLLDQLQQAGYGKVILCVGYQAEQIRNQLGATFGSMELVYSVEDAPLGTAGALRQAADLSSTSDVLAMNGDSFCQMDLASFADAHRRFDGAATVAVLHRDDRSRAGAIEMNGDGCIVSFAPRPIANSPGYINAGVYMFRRQVLLEIPARQKCSLEEEILPGLVEKRSLFGWPVGPDFIDIGTPETYRDAQSFFAKR